MKKLYIRRASELVTCRGSAPKKGAEMADIGLIKNGGVLIHDDQIFAVGTTEELDLLAGFEEGSGQADACTETASGYTVLDASGKTVLPGFVDSHTHFIFGGYRAEEFSWRLKGDTYMSIMERGGGINATVGPTRDASIQELVSVGRERMNRMLEFGVTTVEGKSGYGMDRNTELKQLRAMKELLEKRRASQPLEFPSAGSTFKRPEGYYAGTLIDQCGLKGLTVGGAQVSEKHAGFVINRGGATCADVKELIRQIQERVFAQAGVRLEPEVRIID